MYNQAQLLLDPDIIFISYLKISKLLFLDMFKRCEPTAKSSLLLVWIFFLTGSGQCSLIPDFSYTRICHAPA